MGSACATPSLRSPYRPELPPEPILRRAPAMGQCRIADEPAPVWCVLILREDWDAILQWALALQREARAACLALGWDPRTCGVEPEATPEPAGERERLDRR